MEIEETKQIQKNDHSELVPLFQFEINHKELDCVILASQSEQYEGKIIFTNFRIIFLEIHENRKVVSKILSLNSLFPYNKVKEIQDDTDYDIPVENKQIRNKEFTYLGRQLSEIWVIKFFDYPKLIIFDTISYDDYQRITKDIWTMFVKKRQEEDYVKGIILSQNEDLQQYYTEMVIGKNLVSDQEFWENNKEFRQQYLNKIVSKQNQKDFNNFVQTKKDQKTYEDEKEVNLHYTLEKNFDLENFQNNQKGVIDKLNERSFQQFRKQVENSNNQEQKMEQEFQQKVGINSQIEEEDEQITIKKTLQTANNNNNQNQQQLQLIQSHQQNFKNAFQASLNKLAQKGNANQVVIKKEERVTKNTVDISKEVIQGVAKIARASKSSAQEDIDKINKKDEFCQMYRKYNFQVTELIQWYYKEKKLNRNEENEQKLNMLREELKSIKEQLKKLSDNFTKNINDFNKFVKQNKNSKDPKIKKEREEKGQMVDQEKWKNSVICELINQIQVALAN